MKEKTATRSTKIKKDDGLEGRQDRSRVHAEMSY